jgi:hypothetical protein
VIDTLAVRRVSSPAIARRHSVAVSNVAHKPDLTKEQVREIFRAHFEPRCKIEDWKSPLVSRDFVVVKNPFVGVAVKLEQGQTDTKFVYGGVAPRVWARLLFSGLLSLFLWNGLTSEVKQFIETAPEFK